MDADFSIELGKHDPVLDLPWTDPSGRLAYFDLKRHPDLIAKIEEAQAFPEVAELLIKLNSSRSPIESAKCDVWSTTELSADEAIYRSSHKLACYVDVVFSDLEKRSSFSLHEGLVKKLCELLRRAPEIPSALEICLRRCFFPRGTNTREGFYLTVYANGYGNDQLEARRNLAVALQLTGNAILQLSLSYQGIP